MKTFSPVEQPSAHFLTADTAYGVHKVNDKTLKKFMIMLCNPEGAMPREEHLGPQVTLEQVACNQCPVG